MTVVGTALKTLLLVAMVVAAAVPGWMFLGESPGLVIAAVLVAFGVAIAVTFRPKYAPILAPLYAMLEGAAVGAVSSWYAHGDVRYNSNVSTVVSAAALTVAILVVLLAAYVSGLIRPSAKFKMGITAATGGIALYYLVAILTSGFGLEVPLIWSTGTGGIIFSLLVTGIAAANLVLDFDFIDQAVRRGAPKHYEWVGAFGLCVTLVWLYLELLRLLAKSQSRR